MFHFPSSEGGKFFERRVLTFHLGLIDIEVVLEATRTEGMWLVASQQSSLAVILISFFEKKKKKKKKC